MGNAIKHDQAKPKMGLISTRFLKGLAQVLTFGAHKYAVHNWRKGLATSRLYDALQRHLTDWNDGQDLDPESGLSHLYHASCCLMFLAETVEVRPDLDDRYKPHGPETRDSLPPEHSAAVPEKSSEHCCISNPAGCHQRHPGPVALHVRPLCGVGVEERQGQAEPLTGPHSSTGEN